MNILEKTYEIKEQTFGKPNLDKISKPFLAYSKNGTAEGVNQSPMLRLLLDEDFYRHFSEFIYFVFVVKKMNLKFDWINTRTTLKILYNSQTSVIVYNANQTI